MFVGVNIRTWDGSWKKLTEDPAAYAALRQAVPALPEDSKAYTGYDEPIIVDEVGLRGIARAGLAVELKPAAEGTMLTKLQDRIAALEMRRSGEAEQALAGAIVQIHVPDLALMAVREVTHLNDCCTDELQRHLNEGWHLLAVCPPNAARRPDYILGRSKEKST